MSSNDNHNDQIDLACRGFRNAVLAFCRRFCEGAISEEQELPPDVQDLVDHSSHLLRQLTTKRRSLENGLSNLRQNLWPDVLDRFRQTNTNSDERATLLQHFLEQCLRLHDGMLLLVSGECRHPGDIRRAKKQATNQFHSRLKSQRTRGDGYTKLFNAPGGYSGYGWDEFHDEEVGIKVLLLGKLQKYSARTVGPGGRKRCKSKDKIWDYLLENGGQSFEGVLDQHESCGTMIDQGFTALRDQVVKDLKLFSAKTTSNNTKVSFVLHDKLEKLKYGDIAFERQGDQFQVSDPKGALPNGYSVQDWQNMMQLPPLSYPRENSMKSSKSSSSCRSATPKQDNPTAKNLAAKKKRRRILEDSSDEEDDTPPTSKPKKSEARVQNSSSSTTTTQKEQEAQKEKNPPVIPSSNKISGLNVRIRKQRDNPPTPSGVGGGEALAAIKAKFGVQGESLEAAREVLELEEANASEAAKAEEAEAMATTIQEGEALIQTQRQVLQTLQSQGKRDISDIWSVREKLREQLVAVGNQIIESDPSTNEDETQANSIERKPMLQKAHKYFEEAVGVIEDQEELRLQLRQQEKHTPRESRFHSRRLLLLWGRAYTNMGIANVKLAGVTKRKTNYNTVDSKRYLRQAKEDLDKATEYGRSLKKRCTQDRKRGDNERETKADSVEANQLESLAMLWCGKALWRLDSREEAAEKFDYAASLFSASIESFSNNDLKDEGIPEKLLELGTQCYNSHATHADLIWVELTTLPPPVSPGATLEGDDLCSCMKLRLKKASDLSDAINNFFELVDSEQDESPVISHKKIHELKVEREQWWEEQKEVYNKPVPKQAMPKAQERIVHRSDVNPHGLRRALMPPTRRFVVHEGSSRRKKKNTGPMYHQHSGSSRSALSRYDGPDHGLPPPDEEEPKQYRPWGDELLPGGKLQYPSIAPSMPEFIRSQLQTAN